MVTRKIKNFPLPGSVETISRTSGSAGNLSRKAKGETIFLDFRQGMSMTELSQKYALSIGSLYRIIGPLRAERIRSFPLDYIPSPEFREDISPAAEEEILGFSLPAILDVSKRRRRRTDPNPEDLPPFLLQLGCRPLLSGDEESRLFRKMNYLKFKAAILRRRMEKEGVKAPLMSRIESLYNESVAVKNEIVAANLRLVISIAKKHANPNLSFYELISDGNFSLLKAVEKFDYTRGNKFSTYASWALFRNFARSIPDERKHQDRFRAADVEVFESRMEDRRSLWQDLRVHKERVTQIHRLMKELDDRERTIIQRRYGLGEHDHPQTLRQVGRDIGVTKERVRQIETRAMEKLRKAAKENKMEIPESLF